MPSHKVCPHPNPSPAPRERGSEGSPLGSRVRHPPRRDELRANAAEDLIHVFEDVPVEEAQDREPEALEPEIAGSVALSLVSVRRPVGLDHEAGVGAEEVGDEGTDGVLAAKFRARKPSIAQQLPQHPLGRRRGPT